MFGEVQVYWNITPAVVSQFEEIAGTVTMGDRQSAATIILKVLRSSPKPLGRYSLDCIMIISPPK